MQNPAGEHYSAVWYRTFLDSIPAAQTKAEIEFLKRQLPVAAYPAILDLCCGSGRHAIPLAEAGYDVTGVDRDAAAVARARTAAPAGASFVQADVRAYLRTTMVRDATIIMWASFGYFQPDENRALLDAIVRGLRPGGRLVLDVYNRDWFVAHQGERRSEREGLAITEYKSVAGDRLTIELHYDGHSVVDRFSWQVFTPAELADTLAQAGLDTVTLCAAFDESTAAASGHARMQIVAEKGSVG